jgi:hypothetical protein
MDLRQLCSQQEKPVPKYRKGQFKMGVISTSSSALPFKRNQQVYLRTKKKYFAQNKLKNKSLSLEAFPASVSAGIRLGFGV